MNRRKFFHLTFGGVIGLSGLRPFQAAGRSTDNPPSGKTLEKRPLGKTGEKLSIIGLGGLVLANETQDKANQIVRDAIEAGVNYFDVAPSYGNAEDRMGPALKPFRKNVFLACKTLKRDRQGAEEELASSLGKLKTDHVDLYQLHALSKTEDVQQALGPRGALETFRKAREDGKIRFIGFSAHSQEAALQAMEQFDFDTVLFPFNFVCFLKVDFGPAVMKKAKEKRMGILALKALARQPWPNADLKKEWPKAWYQPLTDPVELALGLRFTLSQPITAAVPPGDARLFYPALEVARSFTPLSRQEDNDVRRLASDLKPLFELHPGS
jgi:predicted aldo/keto reductase-like oxidoreductase